MFRLKQFSIAHDHSAMKVGEDALLFGAWVEALAPSHILDVGSGSGILTLMMAQRFEASVIVGVELDPKAAQESRENIANSPWTYPQIVSCDFLRFNAQYRFDLIVSNPPYFQHSLPSSEQGRSLARHDQHLPLGKMVEKAERILSSEGVFCLIIPADRSDELRALCASVALYPSKSCYVRSSSEKSPHRLMIAFQREMKQAELTSEIVVRNKEGGYSDEFKSLTRDFYLKH